MINRIKSLITGRMRKHVNGSDAPTQAVAAEQPPPCPHWTYFSDGLATVHNCDFMSEPAFRTAYERGVAAAGADYGWHWRVHVGIWVASVASELPGDFVECGVNRGFMSSTVMRSLNWSRLGKTFYLLDTFAGVDEGLLTEEERSAGAIERNLMHLAEGFYTSVVQEVRENFSEWQNVKIIQGRIPETLEQVDAERVSFLHIDMNCAAPEVAAAEYFWPKLTPGAFVLLDDYAYKGYEPQKAAMDEFARRAGVPVLSLPTGQGMMVKPPIAQARG